MKEIKINIKLTVYADENDKEALDEAVYQELQDQMEGEALLYTHKVVESEDDEDEEEEELDEFVF